MQVLLARGWNFVLKVAFHVWLAVVMVLVSNVSHRWFDNFLPFLGRRLCFFGLLLAMLKSYYCSRGANELN